MTACQDFVKILYVHFGLQVTQDMMKCFSFVAPFLPDLLRCLIRLALDRGPKFTKKRIAMAVLL